MDKKITRRVVLGTIITGLVAAPFVMRSIRHRRSQEQIDAAFFEYAYGKIDIPPEKIESDLPISERTRALEIFEKERKRWLSFRGVEANISLSPEKPGDPNTQGFINFSLLGVNHVADRGTVPFKSKMVFSKSQGATPSFTFSSNRNDGTTNLDGEQVVGMDPNFVSQFLSSPSEIFSGLSNIALQEILAGYWSISGTIDALVFKASDKKLTDDGWQFPELELREGRLAAYISKRNKDNPYSVMQFESFHDSSGFLYPAVQRLVIKDPKSDAGKSVLSETTLTLSDIRVART